MGAWDDDDDDNEKNSGAIQLTTVNSKSKNKKSKFKNSDKKKLSPSSSKSNSNGYRNRNLKSSTLRTRSPKLRNVSLDSGDDDGFADFSNNSNKERRQSGDKVRLKLNVSNKKKMVKRVQQIKKK